jgi:hypothetical protein
MQNTSLSIDEIQIRFPPHTASLMRIGSLRMRLPLAAKMAFATAGAAGGTPGSPTPVGCSMLGTM